MILFIFYANHYQLLKVQLYVERKKKNFVFVFIFTLFCQLQSTYSTDDGCLVFPLDKAEQGFDLLQNAINSVCGTDEAWFDFAVQMGPYETFDYVK